MLDRVRPNLDSNSMSCGKFRMRSVFAKWVRILYSISFVRVPVLSVEHRVAREQVELLEQFLLT